jgi:hypothetical protein
MFIVFLYFLAISLGILLIALNVYAMIGIEDNFVRCVSALFMTFAFTRYISLIAFLTAGGSQNLSAIAPFIFSTAIGFTIPAAFSLYSLYKRSGFIKFPPYRLFLGLLPFMLFYIMLIAKAPKEVVQSNYGFKVLLNKDWTVWLAIVQTIFTTGIIVGATQLILKAKNIYIKRKAFFLDIGFIVLLIDGVLRTANVNMLQFVYAEVFALLCLLLSIDTKR